MIRALAAVLVPAASSFAQSFAAPSPVPITGNAASVAVGDLNHDGRPDLVAGYTGGPIPAFSGVSVALASGPDAFAPATPYSNGTSNAAVRAVALADLNGDGHLDAVCANSSEPFFQDSVSVLLGNGAGAFGNATTFTIGLSYLPDSLAVFDVNGDGKLDVVTTNHSNNGVSILIGNGAGGLAHTGDVFFFATSTIAGASADLNLDGNVDLFVLSLHTQTPENAVEVLLGTGTTLGAPTSHLMGLLIGFFQGGIAAGDANGDGRPDAVTANPSLASVSRMLGNGAGALAAPVSFAVATNPVAVAIGDVNGDGGVDLTSANGSSGNVSVLRANGAGGFATAVSFPAGALPTALRIADFGVDGKADLAVANASGATVSVLRGDAPTPAGLADFGMGTPGCAGTIGILGGSSPALGNAAFGYTATNAPASSLGLALVADVQDLAGSDPFGIGIVLHVDLFASALLLGHDAHSDASGNAFAPAPIPSLPSLVGVTIFAQSVWIESASKCGASPFGILTSAGLSLTIQP